MGRIQTTRTARTNGWNALVGLAFVAFSGGCRTQTPALTEGTGSPAVVEQAETSYPLAPDVSPGTTIPGADTDSGASLDTERAVRSQPGATPPVPPPDFERNDGRVGGKLTAEEIERWIWLAGRPRLAGLPAARQSERDAQRKRALERLGDDIERRGSRRSAVLRHLRELFQSVRTSNELWSSSARVAGQLELYEFAEYIAQPMLAGVSGPRHLASATALHALFGRWFVDADELVPYLEHVRAGSDTELFLGSLADEEDLSRRRLFALLETDPSRAMGFLTHRDPRIRGGAAGILGQAFSLPGADPKAIHTSLLDMLESEEDPLAFHLALGAIVPQLELADAHAPELKRLRYLLANVATSADDARSMSAVQVLGRLPWVTTGQNEPAHILSGIGLVGEALRDLADAERRRGAFDPDPLVNAFQALEVLCDRAVAGNLASELRGSRARHAVISILEDAALGSAVRSMAGSALGPLALSSDAPLFVRVLLESATDPAVAHALLGAAGELLVTFDPQTREVREILAAVAQLSGARDPDLRRRALQLLADEKLERHVATIDRSFLVERIEEEEIADLDRTLLALLRRLGKGQLEPLLDVKRLPELAKDSGALSELALTLTKLAEERPHLTMLAASKLASIGNEETLHAARQHALSMVASLKEAALAALTPDEHRSICTWAWQLHEAGIPLEEVLPKNDTFISQLASMHIPRAQRAGEIGDLPTAALEHLNALVEAHLYLKADKQGAKGNIERSFKQAYELTRDSDLRLLVLRDRARFRAEVGETVGALDDFRELLRVDALHVPDVRIAIAILQGGGAGPADDPSVVREVCELFSTLARMKFWNREPPTVRLQDLEDWGSIAIGTKQRELVAAVAAALVDMPKTQPQETQDSGDHPPVWAGLLREAEHFQTLTSLQARIMAELAGLESR